MSFTTQQPAQSYRRLGAETGLIDADPHRIIALLYDGALDAINRARHALANADIAARGEAVSSAIRIIHEGLQAALDLSAGEIARNLSALYDYMCARLLAANRGADDAILAEVAALLQQLRAGWAGIAPQGDAPAGARRVTAAAV